jgi:hypothetical protein
MYLRMQNIWDQEFMCKVGAGTEILFVQGKIRSRRQFRVPEISDGCR